MFIQTEETPNPATLKFLPGRSVLPGKNMEFRSPDDAVGSPLAQVLFEIEGVIGVFFSEDFIAITKDDSREWPIMKPGLLGAIMEHFTANRPIVLDGETDAADDGIAHDDDEIVSQIKNNQISHIILQAGVGGMAGAMVAGIARYLENVPEIIVVEPDSAACVMESIRTGKLEKIDIKRESLMGGMSCGEVSLVPWEILKNSVKYCISLSDEDIANTMKLLGNASFSDEKIIAGENSAPGVISLIASCEDEKIKEKIKLDNYSNVLLIGCEGDTDKEMYQKLIKF